MSVLDTLIAARDLISDPSRWTKECFARDARGNVTLAKGSEAVCWCAAGAVMHEASGSYDELKGIEYLNSSVARTKYRHSVDFNDKRSHADVMKMFDRAIRIAKDSAP